MNKKIRNSSRLIAVIMMALMLASLFSGCKAEEKVVGIAWRADLDSEFYTNVVQTVKKAGAKPVLLDQVVAEYLTYDEKGNLIDCSDEVGAMTQDAAEKIKENLWENTNVKEVMKEIDAVIFTGGEDISSSLFREPEPWHGIEAEIDYNPTRDASDYILMSYCIENDIATLGFCRGMQMMAVVGGAEMIQDIPTHFDALDKEYGYEHRNEKQTPDSYRDYAPHDVKILKDSLAEEVFKTDNVKGCPSWHHQAVLSVENTDLLVSGSVDTNTEEMIEIIEYKDKDFVLGLQFHPEAAVVKNMNNVENASEFMDVETAMLVFEALVSRID